METPYPLVTIDGNPYLLKLTLAALRRLESWGIDLNVKFRQPTEAEPITAAESAAINHVMAAKAAAYAHVENASGKLKWAMIGVDEMEELLTLADIAPVSIAIAECEGKAVRDANPSPAALPASEPVTEQTNG